MGIWDIIAGPVFKMLDKIIPDPQAKAQAQLQLIQLQQAGEFKELETDLALAQGQMETNKTEATNPSLLVSGWRPAIGWICGSGLAVQFLVSPLFTWGAALAGHPIVFPQLDMGTLLTLLGGMLGLGSLRTVEKLKGVAAV